MRPELAGALIRRARLEKNWSQEGLCRGICSVSWLSKIESGREGADPELIAALFARLGMDTDERPGQAELIERCYEAAFSLNYGLWDALRSELAAAGLENGPHCVDAALLGQLFSEEQGAPDWIADMEPALEPRQRSLLLWLSGDYEALCRIDGSACAFYLYGYEAYCAGSNTLALELLERACRLAADEGRLRILMNARLTIGNCYSNGMQYEAMLRHYEAAERMARALGAGRRRPTTRSQGSAWRAPWNCTSWPWPASCWESAKRPSRPSNARRTPPRPRPSPCAISRRASAASSATASSTRTTSSARNTARSSWSSSRPCGASCP